MKKREDKIETFEEIDEKNIDGFSLRKGIKMYYAVMMPSLAMFEIYELKIRTVKNEYFVGIEEKNKHSYLFNYNDVNKIVFFDRKTALEVCKEAEAIAKKNGKYKTCEEKGYEEY